MAEATYEVLFLLDPNKFSSDPDGVTAAVNGVLEHYGATIEFTSHWGEIRLAYPIKRFKKGSYLLTIFRIAPSQIPHIEHDLKLQDAVIRHLVIRHHPLIAEGILDHLLGRHHEEPEGEQETQEQAAGAPA